MTTAQGEKIRGFADVAGIDPGTYEGTFHAACDAIGIAPGMFNERLVAYLQGLTGSTDTNLTNLQQLAADQAGADNWWALGYEAATQYSLLFDGSSYGQFATAIELQSFGDYVEVEVTPSVVDGSGDYILASNADSDDRLWIDASSDWAAQYDDTGSTTRTLDTATPAVVGQKDTLRLTYNADGATLTLNGSDTDISNVPGLSAVDLLNVACNHAQSANFNGVIHRIKYVSASALQGRNGVQGDGSIYGTIPMITLAGDFTFSWEGERQDATGSSSQYLFYGDASNYIRLYDTGAASANRLLVRQGGANRVFDGSFTNVPVGKKYRASIAVAGTTITLTVDGVDDSTTWNETDFIIGYLGYSSLTWATGTIIGDVTIVDQSGAEDVTYVIDTRGDDTNDIPITIDGVASTPGEWQNYDPGTDQVALPVLDRDYPCNDNLTTHLADRLHPGDSDYYINLTNVSAGDWLRTSAPMNPAALYSASDEGEYLDFSDLGSLYEDAAGTTPWSDNFLNTVGQVNGIRGEFVARQAVGAYQPTVDVYPPHLVADGVNDVFNLSVLVDLGSDATIFYVDENGVTITGGQTIGTGNYDILAAISGVKCYFFGVIDRALTAEEGYRLNLYLYNNYVATQRSETALDTIAADYNTTDGATNYVMALGTANKVHWVYHDGGTRDFDTKTGLASASKLLSDILLARAVQAGQINYATRISSIIDGWSDIDDPNNYHLQIRVKHLPTMTGGMDFDAGTEIANWDTESEPIQNIMDDIIAYLTTNGFGSQPGTAMSYGPLCYKLMTYVLQETSEAFFGESKTIHELMDYYITTPLGLDELQYSDPASTNPNIAGEWQCSARDWIKICQAMLDNTLFSNAEKAVIFNPQDGTDENSASNSPLTGFQALWPNPDPIDSWRRGYVGWLECENTADATHTETTAVMGNGAFGWYAWINPSAGTFGVVGVQDASGGFDGQQIGRELRIEYES